MSHRNLKFNIPHNVLSSPHTQNSLFIPFIQARAHECVSDLILLTHFIQSIIPLGLYSSVLLMYLHSLIHNLLEQFNSFSYFQNPQVYLLHEKLVYISYSKGIVRNILCFAGNTISPIITQLWPEHKSNQTKYREMDGYVPIKFHV